MGNLEGFLEILTDIAYFSGHKGITTGDSRVDVQGIICRAEEFQNIHKSTDWNKVDYIETIDQFCFDMLENRSK